MIKNFFFVLAILSGLVVGSSYPAPQTALAQSPDPVLVGAGDIANCSHNNDEATANLLDNIAGTVFTVGDNVYPDGAPAEFANCYNPTWGRHKDRTRPAPGNHDYHIAGASGYYNYFGSLAGDPGKGYYSYNLGAWHIISLNSEVGYQAGSAQEQWLRADLAANNSMCTLAYWHHPRFSSGQHGNSTRSQAFWQALYDDGADVVLNGHDHTYQRFAPQSPSGQAEPNRGIREFVVGTGGAGLYPFPTTVPNTEVRNNTTFGVLKLTLHATSYDWQFVPIAGQTFTDSGTGNCVGGGINPTPTRTPTSGPGPTATRTPTATSTNTPAPGTSTGFLPPSASAAQTSSAGDNNGYQTNPTNAFNDNSVFAVDTNSGKNSNSSCTNNGKDKHHFYNYNFNLPPTAVVQGLQVRLDARVDATGGNPKICVQISWNGGSSWTTAKPTSTLSTAEMTYTLGSTSDTWGRTWAVGNFTNPNFRIRVIDVAGNTSRDFSLDYIAVNVTYQP